MDRMCAVIFLFAFSLLFGCSSTGEKAPNAQLGLGTTEIAPKASEYFLGVGDSVDITVYRHDDLKTSTRINPSGTIMFPLIGEVPAAGKSITELREELRVRFSKYLVDPQIVISIPSIQSQKVLVLGEVRNPGSLNLDTNLTIIEAVSKAGGWTADANLNQVILLRNVSGKVDARTLDMAAVLKGGDFSDNAQLRMSDIVYVPTKKIADVARFMSYITSILSPVVLMESGIILGPQAVDVLQGEKTSTGVTIPAR